MPGRCGRQSVEDIIGPREYYEIEAKRLKQACQGAQSAESNFRAPHPAPVRHPIPENSVPRARATATRIFSAAKPLSAAAPHNSCRTRIRSPITKEAAHAGCARRVRCADVYGTDNTLIPEALMSRAVRFARGPAVLRRTKRSELKHSCSGHRVHSINTRPQRRAELRRRETRRAHQAAAGPAVFLNLRAFRRWYELARGDRHRDDHFARIATADGLAAPPYQALLRLLRRSNVWAKLMGPYFISDAVPHYPDIAPFARGMIEAAPDRIVWGSDWPHPSAREKMPDDGVLADLINEWAPDTKQRQKVLVDNPRQLYGFD